MMKYSLLLLLLSFGIVSAQKTVHVYNQTYQVKGALVCEGYVEPLLEKESKPWVDCYAYLNDHQLIYSRVFTVDKIITLLQVYEVNITMLDLKNAKVDWELDYMSNPQLHCIQLITIDNKSVVNFNQYDGKGAPLTYKNNKLNVDFNDEKKAKDYLKELRAAAKNK
jgi:hypothetical protein